MKLLRSFISVFIITALWDLFWRWMTEGKIHICIDENTEILCPSQWEWVRAGRGFFLSHSVLGGMFIAGCSGVYALILMFFLKPVLGHSVLNLLFSSWAVGIPMRYANDPIHKKLFSNLRIHYYDPLGFALSSYSDAQSGVIVALTYIVLKRLIG